MDEANKVWRICMAWLLAFVVVFSILFITAPVRASHAAVCVPPSAEYETVTATLKQKYSEALWNVLRVGQGRETLVELWVAPDNGTWTLLIRNGNCVRHLGAGTSYDILD